MLNEFADTMEILTKPITSFRGYIIGFFVFMAVLIVLLIAAVVIPNLLEPKKLSPPRGALLTIKSIGLAQEIFKERGDLDADTDEIGEYAMTFAHMCGSCGPNGPPVLGMMPMASDTSLSEKNNYIYKLFIPSRDYGGFVDDDEGKWAVVGWPKKWGGDDDEKIYAMAEDNIPYENKNEYADYEGMSSPVGLYDMFGTPFDNATIVSGKAKLKIKK